MLPRVLLHERQVVIGEILDVLDLRRRHLGEVDLTRLHRIETRVDVGNEAEDDLVDVRVVLTAPVVGIPLHADVFAGLPLDEDEGAGADGTAVVAVVLDDVLALEHVLGQDRLEQPVIDRGRLVPDHDGRVLVLHAAVADRQVGVAVIDLRARADDVLPREADVIGREFVDLVVPHDALL